MGLQSELEQRQLVFWVGFTLDKSMCFRIGRPSALNDEDIGVPIPPESLLDELCMGISVPSNPDRKFHPFRAACYISLIESRVYCELYSARSWMRTPEDRLHRVTLLDQELQEWRSGIPVELRPEGPIQCDPDQRFAIIMLQFAYYNCLTTIHRVSANRGFFASRPGTDAQPKVDRSTEIPLTSDPENLDNYNSYKLCISAARSTIHLATQFLYQENDPRNSLIWLALYYPLTACLTLFANALQCPLDPRTENDLELVERTVTYLSVPSEIGDESVVPMVLGMLGSLVSFARDYTKKRKAEGFTRQKPPLRRGNKFAKGHGSADLPSSPNHPSASEPSSNHTDSNGTKVPTSTAAHTTARTDQSVPFIPFECPSYWAFDFPLFDTSDSDASLHFAHSWNQFDFPATTGFDWDFVELGDGQ